MCASPAKTVGGGTMKEPSMYPARSYPSSKAWIWRLHIRKLESVSLVTFVIFTLRRVMDSEREIISVVVAGEVVGVVDMEKTER